MAKLDLILKCILCYEQSHDGCKAMMDVEKVFTPDGVLNNRLQTLLLLFLFFVLYYLVLSGNFNHLEI